MGCRSNRGDQAGSAVPVAHEIVSEHIQHSVRRILKNNVKKTVIANWACHVYIDSCLMARRRRYT